jgi:chromosome segregation protein
MHLERIELIGFKSFAEKTVFRFHPGTTAIVGPNGCGKSNVVDAFKWVLGEQSAKSLRGDSMEDVIFFGSATKKTKGMAEVTLILSGVNGGSGEVSDNDRDSAAGEISVTRRLYRSGESEYLMNKTHCRLKDIRNMFLDTGLELKAYSILEQGRINHILNSKPQERRFLIEEVAGVMKYKARKSEAIQKLQSSKSNLQRLQDIISEVKRQINSIDRHAKKAERYKKLFEEIRGVDIRIAKRDVERLKQEVEGLTTKENTLKSREAELSANLHSAEALIEEKKRSCVEKEQFLDQLRAKLYSSEKVVTEGEGKKALLASDCENLRGRIRRLHEREVELIRERETSRESLKRVRDEESDMDGSLQSLQSSLDMKKSSFADIESGIAGLEERLESGRKSLFTMAEDISVLKNEVKHLSETREHMSRKNEKSSGEIDSVRNELAALSDAMSEAGDTHRAAGEDLSVEVEKRDEYIADLRQQRDQLTAREEALYRDREGLAAMNSKLDSLQEIEKSQTGSAGEAVQALCQVADIFETPLQYETALEAVLGERLGASVVGGRDDISRAIQSIREQNSARIGFISSESVDQAVLSASPVLEMANTDGVIGNALDLVTVKSGHEKIASALLRDVLFVSDLMTAFSLRDGFSGNPRSGMMYFVTVDGDVLEPSGIVFGGVQKGVLKIKRQMKDLQNGIAARKKSILDAENSIGELKTGISGMEGSLAGIEEDISNKEKHRHELQVRISSLENEEERLKQKLEFLTIEKNDEEQEKENLSGIIRQKETECTRVESGKEEAENTLRATQEEIADTKAALEKARVELTAVRLEITTVKEKMAALSKEAARLESAVRDIDSKLEDIAGERTDIEQAISGKEEEMRQKEEELKASVVLIDRLRGEVSEVNETLEAMNAELEVLEGSQKELFRELEALRKELSHVEVRNTESSMNLKHLIEDVRKTYSLEIETAEVTGEVSPEEEEHLQELKEKLKAIGPVSLGTLEEYEELKTRYEFLTKQQDDLLSSVASLEDTIQKINRSTKQRLTDAFEAMNEKFKEVFNTLFGGGRAELLLAEGDILESGIEIVAQPPGKRLKSLSLLSGGEQALTALSLLFAGFMVKPTPLCLLDEVDAPLDESNTERFISLLGQLSKKIQFITITHNRRTMEAADYMYGVTMEEPGVSNVISMHLTEA